MLRIRLARFGKKHQPFYRVVVIESSKKRDGSYVESLGWYNPLEKDSSKAWSIKKEKYEEWLKKGAKPSEAVLKLMLDRKAKEKLWPNKKSNKETKQKVDVKSEVTTKKTVTEEKPEVEEVKNLENVKQK